MSTLEQSPGCDAGNDRAYARFCQVDGHRIGALFARRDLIDGEVISAYVGPILSRTDALRSTSAYLFSARDVRDRRRRVVIDGDPRHGNLAGYANYVVHTCANAEFVDAAAEAKGDASHTNVLLRAREFIPRGTEIRADYDRGVAGRPFYNQMLADGISRRSLTSPSYKRKSRSP